MAYFNKKTMFLMLVALIICNHPSLSVLCLLILTVYSMIIFKSSMSSLCLLLVLIIFSTGVLLLLFYVTMISDKHVYWNSYYLLWYLILFPWFYYNLNYNQSFLSLSVELTSLKMATLLLISLLTVLFVLTIMNILMLKTKFMRQII